MGSSFSALGGGTGKLGGGIETERMAIKTKPFVPKQVTSYVSEETGWKGVAKQAVRPDSSSFDNLDRFSFDSNSRNAAQPVNNQQFSVPPVSSGPAFPTPPTQPSEMPSWAGGANWGAPPPQPMATAAAPPPTQSSAQPTQQVEHYQWHKPEPTAAPIAFGGGGAKMDFSALSPSLRLQQAREEMLRQSEQNEAMHSARGSNSFIQQYATGTCRL